MVFRDGANDAVWQHDAGGLLGAGPGLRLADGPPALAGVLFRRGGQVRPGPARAGRAGLLCPAGALGAGPLAGHAAGAGARCHHAGRQAGHFDGERPLQRLCGARRLEGAVRWQETSLERRVAGPAHPDRACHSGRLAGAGAHRPRSLRPLALSGHRPPGLASLHAHQQTGHLPCHGCRPAPAPHRLRPPRRHGLGRPGYRLHRRRAPPGLHPARLLGSGL